VRRVVRTYILRLCSVLGSPAGGAVARRSLSGAEEREIPLFLLQWHDKYPQCWRERERERESISRGTGEGERETAASVTDKSVAQLVFPTAPWGWGKKEQVHQSDRQGCCLHTHKHTHTQTHTQTHTHTHTQTPQPGCTRRSSERRLTLRRYSMFVRLYPPLTYKSTHLMLHFVFQVGWRTLRLWINLNITACLKLSPLDEKFPLGD